MWRIAFYFGVGFLIVALYFVSSAVWMYNYLVDFEAGTESVRLHFFFVWVYQLGGKNLAVGMIWLLACLFFGASGYSFINAWRWRKAFFNS